MVTGTENSLGAALNQLLRDHGVQPLRRLSTYHAKHWHAQLSRLTKTQRGYEALERAGLTVRPETLIKWLSDPEYNVRRSYREFLHAAYENVAVVPADPVPESFKNGHCEITGLVKTGDGERFRGGLSNTGRITAPLRIDGRSGNWVEIERKWADDEVFEDDFIEYEYGLSPLRRSPRRKVTVPVRGRRQPGRHRSSMGVALRQGSALHVPRGGSFRMRTGRAI
ncbi:hypothetical protein StrepF001_10845 [Streptomyces sp. F001]|uniref:hypothetical protein n=1 Tax=Streptomyces sp. F001 TaxID=1510026 RepID=UPI00101E4022|nr:hypothetical protein [Streptomyces sp. F001]RZB19345.1 hypothetical protein StrepF001_10845 [Streptomyces sp. F001]